MLKTKSDQAGELTFENMEELALYMESRANRCQERSDEASRNDIRWRMGGKAETWLEVAQMIRNLSMTLAPSEPMKGLGQLFDEYEAEKLEAAKAEDK